MADYTRKLKSDLLEQFKDSPRINALMEAIGEQLRDVSQFYEDLRTQRHIATGVGQQLDGVGDMVVLSRYEALEMVNRAGLGDTITDELYRRYLYYKILKNTNTCTYPDLIKAFRLFWDKPLYYSEKPEQPAVMFLETGVLSIYDHVEDLLTTPIIKAAGVGIHIKATVQFPETERMLHMGGHFSVHARQVMPEQAERFDFQSTVRIGGVPGGMSRQPVPEMEDGIRFQRPVHASGMAGVLSRSPVPEDRSSPMPSLVGRVGGRLTARTVIPITEQKT